MNKSIKSIIPQLIPLLKDLDRIVYLLMRDTDTLTPQEMAQVASSDRFQ